MAFDGTTGEEGAQCGPKFWLLLCKPGGAGNCPSEVQLPGLQGLAAADVACVHGQPAAAGAESAGRHVALPLGNLLSLLPL